jgi:hypothetical protein
MPVQRRTGKGATANLSDKTLNAPSTKNTNSVKGVSIFIIWKHGTQRIFQSGTPLLLIALVLSSLLVGWSFWDGKIFSQLDKSSAVGPPFQVAKLPGKGMGLVATRPIQVCDVSS